jgi:hypothetical protein
MSAPTLIITSGILHRSDESLTAIRHAVLRLRRQRSITRERAADALYDLEYLDYQDELADQLGYLLANPDLFPDPFALIRGSVLNRDPARSRLFRDELADYIAFFRGEHVLLPGEVPVYQTGADQCARTGV